MKSKEILPEDDRREIRNLGDLSFIVGGMGNEALRVIRTYNALVAAESEIEELKKENQELKRRLNEKEKFNITLMRWHEGDLNQIANANLKIVSLKEKVDWIERNYPDIHKQIPR